MKIFKPDLVIVLFVDPNICYQNILSKQLRNYAGETNIDQAEANFEHQNRAADEYRYMIKKYSNWWVGIDCCEEGKLLSPEKIAIKIKKVVDFD